MIAPLPVQRAHDLPTDTGGLTSWLIEGLWCDQAVGIVGGEPTALALALLRAVPAPSAAPATTPVERVR